LRLGSEGTIGVKNRFSKSQRLTMVEVSVPSFVYSALLLLATLGCIISGLLIRFAIISEINSKRGARSQVSFLDRDFLEILSLHRQLFPNSQLRGFQILMVVLSVVFGLGFTLAQTLRI
jgi:hypothetical protein